jgi:flotillin
MFRRSLSYKRSIVNSSYIWSFSYKVCTSSQFLIKTGAFVKDGIQFGKTAIKFPGQYVSYVDMNPITYEFNIHNMSKEKVEFRLPMVFTVCVINPNESKEGFMNYAVTTHNMEEDDIPRIIGGIVEGETRIFTAGMTIEEMFSDKETFKEKVVKKINNDLFQIGLKIINANIREMADYDENNKYFVYRKQRAIETANYEAQVAVAEAKKSGELGVNEKERDIRIAKAQYEQDAKLKENERNQSVAISNAELKIVQAESKRKEELAIIEARSSNEIRNQELMKQIEEKRKEQEEAKYRSDMLSKANVQAEVTKKNADAELYKKQTEFDAELYKKQKEAEGILVMKQKEAEGVRAMYDAQAQGLEKILKSAGDINLASFYLGLQSDIYPKLAKEAANAVHGMQPKVTIINSDGKDNSFDPIVGMMGKIVPGLDLIRDTFMVPSKQNSNVHLEKNNTDSAIVLKQQENIK